MNKISNLQRDYLAEIYQIAAFTEDGFVATAALAERLLTSQSTVNRVIERLRDANLIQHQRYVGVTLTARGQREALRLLRKQGIIEAFLVEVMGFEWYEVYEEARQLRHKVSDVIQQRMWEMAGRPARSPFGEWIAPGSPPADDEIVLTDAEVKHHYRLVRVLTRQPDRLEYLGALELMPGARLHLLHIAPFGGPLQIQLEREYRIVGHTLAKLLVVTPHPAR